MFFSLTAPPSLSTSLSLSLCLCFSLFLSLCLTLSLCLSTVYHRCLSLEFTIFGDNLLINMGKCALSLILVTDKPILIAIIDGSIKEVHRIVGM